MLNPRRLHAQRGQTLIEWAVFMPVLIATMLALIFYSRLGVLSERSQSAVRYGEMVSFKNGNPYTIATVESVIDEILHSSSSELGPLCLQPNSAIPGATLAPATVPPILEPISVASAIPSASATPAPSSTSIANRVATDTQAALIQAQVVGAASPSAPSAKPYWRPDTIIASNCNPASISLQGSSSYGVGNLPISVQTVSVASSLHIPNYLSFIANGETSAKMGFLNVATPNVLLACVPGLNIALSVLAPATAGKAGPACPALPVAASPTSLLGQ
jgi:hypothetical protein